MSIHPLFDAQDGWDTSRLPAPFNALTARSSNQDTFSEFHDARRAYTTLHAGIVTAIAELCKGDDSSIALVKIGNNVYATEQELPDGRTALFRLQENGACHGAIKELSGRYTMLPTINDPNAPFDTAPIFLAILAQLVDKSEGARQKLENTVATYVKDKLFVADNFYYLCDAVYFGIKANAVKATMPGGNIGMLTKQMVKLGAANGTPLCGKPKELCQAVATGNAQTTLTFGNAVKQFAEWRDSMSWTAEEEALIPVFPDDYPVPPEAMKIASRYVGTHGNKRPMVNFMWRGITSYGKSTGVELMAAMLHMPLLRVTCHSTMETQEFLSNLIPVSQGKAFSGELPTFTEISFDPATAYEKLTGKEDENATPDMCLEAYANAVASKASNGSGSYFKQVESNFVTALAKGYIVEVQEISRIKDAGVLVGLNEYDRPGAIIPLVDGSFVRRNENAMVVYTDNVGYGSCRPIDPSVLRRMSFIIDSYDLPKKDALDRVVYNTGFDDKALLDKMYDVWTKIQEFCVDRDYTDGSISVTELEMWAQAVMLDNYDNLYENCIDCVVAKATSVPSEQKEIIASVLAVHLEAA